MRTLDATEQEEAFFNAQYELSERLNSLDNEAHRAAGKNILQAVRNSSTIHPLAELTQALQQTTAFIQYPNQENKNQLEQTGQQFMRKVSWKARYVGLAIMAFGTLFACLGATGSLSIAFLTYTQLIPPVFMIVSACYGGGAAAAGFFAHYGYKLHRQNKPVVSEAILNNLNRLNVKV